MILVIGGRASGKLDYIRSLGYQDDEIAEARLDERPVLYGLQELLRQKPEAAAQLLPELKGKEVVVCDEVGLGIVPLDKEDRAYREAVGRLCVQLAREAEQVVRLVCGIPQVIKDTTTEAR